MSGAARELRMLKRLEIIQYNFNEYNFNETGFNHVALHYDCALKIISFVYLAFALLKDCGNK